MNNKHTGVIGDRPGERVDKEWDRTLRTAADNEAESRLLRAMEQHAYAITGKLFGQRRPDVVNKALTRAWKGMGKFRGDSRFSTWFHRIVVNTSKAHGAKETLRRRREVSIDEVIELAANGSASSAMVIQAAITSKEWEFLWDKTIACLPDAEVAAKWGLSLSGVRGKWHRIKRKIQAALG